MTTDSHHPSVTPTQLMAALASPNALRLVDVRDPWEWDIVSLPGSRRIPLGELAARRHELDPDADIVLYCHDGIRSHEAMHVLEDGGFRHVWHLSGGIDAWATDIDPTAARY